MTMTTMDAVMARTRPIKLLVLDVDGVLTDGSIIIGVDGEEYKTFHSRDGHGIKLLQHTGVEIAVISGRTAKAVEHRMKSLGVTRLYQGQQIKLPVFDQILADLKLAADQCAYVGDDWVDLGIMGRVGLAVAVQDADARVKLKAHWVTTAKGGKGAVREVCELIMQGQGTLQDQIERHY